MLIYYFGFIFLFLFAIIDLDKSSLDPRLIKVRMIFFSFITLILVLFAGMKKTGTGVDDFFYLDMFNDARQGIIYKDIGFFLISNLLSKLNYLFLFFALIGIALKGIYFVRNTKYIGIVFLLYYSSYYFLHDLVQIRAGIASGLILWIIYYAGQKSYFKYILLCILAASFHISALCIIPIIFLKNKQSKSFYIFFGVLSLFIALVIPFKITEFASLFPRFIYERIWYLLPQGKEGVNLLNPILVIHYIMAILIFIYWEKLVNFSSYSVYLIKSFLIGIYLLLIFHNSAVAFRIYELFLIVQIPLASIFIQEIKPKYITVPLVLLLCFIYFFYYIIKNPIVNAYSFCF